MGIDCQIGKCIIRVLYGCCKFCSFTASCRHKCGSLEDEQCMDWIEPAEMQTASDAAEWV